jgi:hypothetical protein
MTYVHGFYVAEMRVGEADEKKLQCSGTKPSVGRS